MEEEKNSNVDVEEKFTPSDSNEKKGGSKIISGIIALLVIIAIVAVGTYFALLKVEQNNARKTVEEVFNSIKTGDVETVDKYLGGGDSVAEEDQTFMLFFKPLNYNIKKVEADFKNATVEVEVSNKDCGKIFQNYFSKIFELSFSNALSEDYTQKSLESELEKYLQEQFESEGIETVTTTISLKLHKNGTVWEPNDDDENVNQFINAVLPNFSSAMEGIQSSMENMQ